MDQVQSIFELFSRKATNRTIGYLIRLNVEVLTALQSAAEDDRWMKQSRIDEIQMTVEHTSPADQSEIRSLNYQLSLYQGWHKVSTSWIEVLDLEGRISQLALERLNLAI